MIKLLMQIKRFDLIIKTIDGNDDMQMVHLLLIAHVGDMLYVINDEAPELLDKYRKEKK